MRHRHAGKEFNQTGLAVRSGALEGNTFIESIAEEIFEKDIRFWKTTMNHYLKTAKALPGPDADHWLKADDYMIDTVYPIEACFQ